MDISVFLKPLVTAFVSFTLPKLKNAKFYRDFKDKWFKDNYPQKMTLMFQAAVDDAKALLDLPDEVIMHLLDDNLNRQVIFRWIIEGTSDDEYSFDHFFLEPYFEQFPEHQDKFLSFFKLILLKINEYKEKNWDPEFQNILYSINLLRDDIRVGFEKLEEQNERNINKIEETVQSTLYKTLGPVGYEDLKELIEKGKLVTARKKAEERIKHTHTRLESLELNAVIANSHIIAGETKQAIPYLYAAITCCDDESRKNRLVVLINIFEEKLEDAYQLIEKSISVEGYTKQNLELHLNILLLQEEYEECLALLEKYGDDSLDELHAKILLAVKDYERVIEIVKKGLEKEPLSKDGVLLLAETYTMQLEENISQGNSVDPEEVLKQVTPLLEKVKEDNENKRQLKRVNELYAALYFRCRQFKDAAIYYGEVYKDSFEDEKEKYLINWLWSMYLSKDWDNAIGFLKKQIKNNENEELVILLARIYLDSGNPRESLQTLKDFEEKNKNIVNMEYYFLKLETLYRLFRHKDIHYLINQVEVTNKKPLKFVINGYYSILQNDWDTAISQLEAAANQLQNQELLEVNLLLVDAYRKRNLKVDHQKLIKLIPAIPHWKHHNSFIDTYINSLYLLGKFDEVLYFFNNEINNPTIISRDVVAAIYYQAEWYEISKDMYENLYHLTDNVRYLFRYSNCLFRLGDSEGCLNTLRMAEMKVKDNANIEDLDLLSLAYLDAMQYEKALDYAYQTFRYGEKNPEVWGAYFWRFLQITQFIDVTKKEYTDAYQKVFSTFQEAFPNEKQPFEQFKAIEEDGKLSNDFLDKLKDMESSQKEIQEIYKKNRLPLQILSDWTKKEPFLIWGHIASRGEHYFWANESGNLSEVIEGLKSLTESKNVLCDLFTIFTLDYLEILDLFGRQFNIYIYQEQFNAFFIEYTQLKLSQYKGLKSISYENDRIVGHEWSPSQVQESLSKMKNIMDWINENGKKVGRAYIEQKDKKDRIMFDDQIQLCKDSLFSFMIDNYIVKEHANRDYGIKSFSVYDFINYILNKKLINQDQYNFLIGKLIMIGYRFISARKEVYIYYLKKNQFKIEGEVQWLFGYLKEAQLNREYVFSVVIEILYWALKEEAVSLKKNTEVISLFCDVIQGENKEKRYLMKFRKKCEEIFNEDTFLLNEFVKIIDSKLSE